MVMVANGKTSFYKYFLAKRSEVLVASTISKSSAEGRVYMGNKAAGPDQGLEILA